MATSGLRLAEVDRLKISIASPCSAFIMVGEYPSTLSHPDRQPNLCEEVVRQNVEAFIQVILLLESIFEKCSHLCFQKTFFIQKYFKSE